MADRPRPHLQGSRSPVERTVRRFTVRGPDPIFRWSMDGTPDSSISAALDRLADFFRKRDTRAGILARRLLGCERQTDGQLAEHLVREGRRKTRIDGSVNGSLADTAWLTWELLDLDCPADHAAVVRTVGYLLSRQDQPGHFAEGCTDERHQRKLCSHFMKGFFSPGGADRPIAPLTFPTGVTAQPEYAARFAVSCAALRVVLRAGEERRTGVLEHLDSLVVLVREPDQLEFDGRQDLAFFALGALALAPPSYRGPLERLAEHLADTQTPDGTWARATTMHALDMLSSVHTPASRGALVRAAPFLCNMRLTNDAPGADEREEAALVAARVLTSVSA